MTDQQVAAGKPPQAAGTARQHEQRRRAVVAACIGNFIEYYDFVVYGYFAAVISTLFFPTEDPAASLLLTFAAFAVSYAARPLGAIIFGHLGDKYGRKTPLAVAILLIAFSTTVIGLMPTYAQIGIAAPIVLTLARTIQGISVGGEYGGATSFISEYAPDNRRGYYTGWQTFTIGLALFTGGAVATLMTNGLSEQALHSWGWRLPFLAGLPLGFVGLYLRLKLEETPFFTEAQEHQVVEKVPLLAGLRLHWRSLLVGMSLVVTPAICIYIYFIYMPTYLSKVLDYDLGTAQAVNLISLAFYCALIPFFAKLSDRVGRRPLMIAGSVAVAIVTYPAFVLAGQGDPVLTTVALCAMGLAFAPHSAVMLVVVAEIFPTKLRYTGVSLSLNIPVTLLGGTAPLIATALVATTGDNRSPALFVVAGAIVTLIGALVVRETYRARLHEV
ncbi:MFS transporter [Kribbella sp. NPDC049227]|uniref:MFS transporter n=1 Tax=Kribbella sp. NPDC049227 TaxID=3364113 RepID=UPI003711D674